jgi:enoyl-CoA hydratase
MDGMDLVRHELADGVATLTLNDPPRRNALSRELVGELLAALDDVEQNPAVRAIVVTGAAPAFCSGADRSDLRAPSEAGLRGIYEGFLRFTRVRVPTIAAVNGPAVGAGFNLALCCDLRLAAESARFDARFLRLGIHPGGGHTWLLRRAIGPAAAAAVVLFGEVLDGPAAERVGLAWRCVPDASLLNEAQSLAGRLSTVPGPLVARTKETFGAMATVDDHDAAVDLELAAQLWSMGVEQ